MSDRPTVRKLRKKGLRRLLIEDAGFDAKVVGGAFLGGAVEAETIATSLRDRLRKIKRGETQSEAPVYTGKVDLARLDISHAAVTMLEALSHQGTPPGNELVSLLSELLDVDRHRIQMAKKTHRGRRLAIFIEAREPELGVRELAREVGTNPGNITKWRSDKEYHRAVEEELNSWAEDWIEAYGKNLFEETDPE